VLIHDVQLDDSPPILSHGPRQGRICLVSFVFEVLTDALNHIFSMTLKCNYMGDITVSCLEVNRVASQRVSHEGMRRLAVLQDLDRPDLNGGSVTVTLRLSSSLRDRLAEEAKARHLSLNAYVEEALERTVEWGVFRAQFEYMTISREVLEILLQQAGDADTAKMADRLFVPRLKDLATLIHGEPDFEGLLHVLEVTAKYQYPLPVTCSIRREGEGVHVFLRHGISKKWSLYVGEACLTYLKDINVQASYEAMEKSLNLNISTLNSRVGGLE